MTVPARLSHIVFMTRRYQALVDWYCTVFKAAPVHADAALTFLAFDEKNHRFAIANLDILRPGGDGQLGDVGVNHVAFSYGGAGDLVETYARLKDAGITPYWPVHHGMTLSLYYQDPDGNRVELQADALLTAWRAGEAELLRLPEGPPSAIPAAHGS